MSTISMRVLGTLALLSLSACAVQEAVYVREPVTYQAPQVVYVQPPVQSVYFEPALMQPEPIRVAWAPPPMLVEVPPPAPFDGMVWIGGFWIWQGDWVWMHARWAPPPHPGYHYVHPYYEHRNGAVIFVNGFWAAADVHFNAPGLNINIAFSAPRPGVPIGPRPMGPEGVFVPPPPGSRYGVIVPAPVGTPPAVVISAPPVINAGMRITNNVNSNNTTVVNHTTVINNYTIVAPANATSNGHAFTGTAPAQPHLAAAMHPVVHVSAPPPPLTLQQQPVKSPQVGQAGSLQVQAPVVNGPSGGASEGNAAKVLIQRPQAEAQHSGEPEMKPVLVSPGASKPIVTTPTAVSAQTRVTPAVGSDSKKSQAELQDERRRVEEAPEVKRHQTELQGERKRVEEVQQETKKRETGRSAELRKENED